MSIPIIQFNLRGQGNSCRVEVEPPISFLQGDTFINYEYSQIVKLSKPTEGTVHYKIRLEGQNRPFDIDLIADGKSLKNLGCIEGEIAVPAIDMEFKLTCATVGLATAFFYIEIEDGPPVAFQV